VYVLQWPDDGRITAETCRPDVINITYLYHLRTAVLQTVHTVLFTVTQRDGLYQKNPRFMVDRPCDNSASLDSLLAQLIHRLV
jgi:hypothetical protein